MSLAKNFDLNFIYSYYFFYMLILPLSFLIKVFYANTLSTEEFGLIYSVIAFFTVVSLFTTAGVNNSLKYFIGKFIANDDRTSISKVFQYSLFIKIILIIIMSLVVYFLSEWLALYYFDSSIAGTVLVIFLLYFIFLKLYDTLKTIFVSYRLNKYYQSAKFLELFSVLFLSVIFFFLLDNQHVFYYALAWGVGTFVSFLVFSFLIFFKFPYLLVIQGFDFDLFKRFISYSVSLFAVGISEKIVSKTDIFMITYFLSLSSVAVYTNVISLVVTAAGTIAAISKVVIPVFSQYQEEGNKKGMSLIVTTLYKQVLFFLFPLTLVFMLFPELILTSIFGDDYSVGAFALTILSIFLMVRILSKFNVAFANGLGYARFLSWVILPVAVFNVIGNFLVVNSFGIEGVAVITGLSWSFIAFASLFKVYREVDINLGFGFFSKVVFLVLVFVGLVLFLRDFVDIFNVYVTGALVLSFSYFVYVVLGYLLGVVRVLDLYVFMPKKFKRYFKSFHKRFFWFLR